MNVWIPPAGVLLEFLHSQVLYLRTYLVCSDSSTLVPAASLAIITLRSSWPWGLDILLAQPQATELVPAYTGKVVVCQYSNGKAYNPPPGCVSCMSTPPPTKSTFRISSCIMMNCQYRHSRDLRTSIPLFTTVPASNCQIPADPSLAFRGFADKIKRSGFASRFFPVHSRQYEGTRRRERDCL
jgi:hypothetical protein